MMLLGERLWGRKALEWGLVNYVVPDEEVEASAWNWRGNSPTARARSA